MRKTVLITGGTGFLGRHLALALREDFDVVLAARNNKQNALAAAETGCRTLPVDVARIDSVRDAVVDGARRDSSCCSNEICRSGGASADGMCGRERRRIAERRSGGSGEGH